MINNYEMYPDSLYTTMKNIRFSLDFFWKKQYFVYKDLRFQQNQENLISNDRFDIDYRIISSLGRTYKF